MPNPLRALVLLAGTTGTLSAQTSAARPGDDLIGLWGAEVEMRSPVHGALSLERTSAGWRLDVGGYRVLAPVTGDSLRIDVPGQAGQLRATQLTVGKPARAYWVHPSARGYDFATPVPLTVAGAGRWTGTITPFGEPVSLYLFIRREADGRLSGVIRNPERGLGVGRRFLVARKGESITLADSATGQVRYTQPYDSAQRTITFNFGFDVVLRPRGRADAPGFWPQSPADVSPRYRAPIARGDGWAVARAGSVALTEDSLSAMIAQLANTDPMDDSQPLVHSVLVARRGRLVLEEYFRGFTVDRVHDTRSATKTLSNVLAGAARRRGVALGPSTPVYATLQPGRALDDPRKARITLRQLFTHSTGLACDDDDEQSPGNEGRMQEQTAERDWMRYALALPVKRDTGAVYAYCSGTMNLAGAMVAATTHQWLPAFFDQSVAQPLGITQWAWNLTPSGDGYTGGGVYLRPRDLLKLGQLYLNGGMWQGRRIVPADWVRESTAHQITTNEGASDGYAWHRNTITVNGRRFDEYEMSGNGGQLVMVVPAADVVVVFTAGSYQRYRAWRKLREELLPRYILGAVRDTR